MVRFAANLQREVNRRLKDRNKEAAMDALLKVAKFDLPKALVEWEMQSLMQQTVRDMESRGMKMKGMPSAAGVVRRTCREARQARPDSC